MMAIATSVANSFKLEILQGIHEPGDDYKIALYTDAATLGAATTAYSATNEIAGTGYTAGGLSLTGYAASLVSGVAILDFDDPAWADATITARGAMIYNASKANRAVGTFDFGANVSSTAAEFRVELPAAGSATAVIRVA
jgi:hypothetical protein